MMKSIKRIALTGAAVMVMMGSAVPAMAAIDPNTPITDYGVSSPVDPPVFNSPDIGIGTAGEGIPPEAGGPTGVGSGNSFPDATDCWHEIPIGGWSWDPSTCYDSKWET